MKLSPKMRTTLQALKDGYRCAYPDLSLVTLHALHTRRLVTRHGGVGEVFSPHTSVKWALTDAGRKEAGL